MRHILRNVRYIRPRLRKMSSTSFHKQATINKSSNISKLLGTSFALGVCASYVYPSFTVEAAPSAIEPTKKVKVSSSIWLHSDFIADAVSKAIPALVNISVEVNSGWGGTGVSTGSGFIITKDGYVVTNNHVVAAGFSGGGTIVVTLSNGKKYNARVHSTDKLSDLALVKLEPKYQEETFPVMELGTSSELKPGQFCIALGSPLTLHNTVTAGIISSVARHSSEIGMHQQNSDYIQTDAAINVGNSGGPLINIQGNVIGINTMKTSQGSGIGFAIPIDTAWQVIKQLRTHRKVVRPWIGMKMVTLDPMVIKHEKLQNPKFPPVRNGVMVVEIFDGSPAKVGGLLAGDIITSFDGNRVSNTNDILNNLGREIGRTIPIIVLRDGTEMRVSIVSATNSNVK
jgi:HtrA serine peptidase 2